MLFCSFCGCTASFFSVYVTVGKDHTQEATIGVISRLGFPIWFTETAPGMGMGEGYHPERWDANRRVWTGFFVCVTVLIASGRFFMKRRQKKGIN